jgi:hypothetical protein
MEEIKWPIIDYEKLSCRILKTEVSINYIQKDIKEIKLTLRWAIGLIFGLNSTIIGLLAKNFNLI